MMLKLHYGIKKHNFTKQQLEHMSSYLKAVTENQLPVLLTGDCIQSMTMAPSLCLTQWFIFMFQDASRTKSCLFYS